MKDIDAALQDWLGRLGLHFDPFWPLDASQDPRLSEYRVGHDTFNAVWGDWVSFVFAPPGGGKTALRVNAAQSCWVGQGTNRPFPISYLPAYVDVAGTDLSWDDHATELSSAAARQLLLALAYRPHWLFTLDAADQQMVAQVLDWNLPGPLRSYTAQCRQAGALQPLLDAFDPTFQLTDPPSVETLVAFCDTLDAFIGASSEPPPPGERWQQIVDLLLNTFEFTALYVMVDGLDAVYETWNDPEAAITSIDDLLKIAPGWSERKIFLKGFFPGETRAVLERDYPDIAAPEHVVTIQWTPELLAQVIQKRIYVASDGAFNSLNAIGSPALPRNIEHVLAQKVIPLPREILVLTRDVLKLHITRTEDENSTLEPEDIDAAVEYYHENLPFLDPDII